MTSKRPLALLAALVALSLPLSGVQAAGDSSTRSGRAPEDRQPHRVVARDFLDRSAAHHRFVGLDGLVYEDAPIAVPGLDGELFYGPDFDIACGLGGESSVTMERASQLAKVIARSGRRVIWTAGPNKTTVLSRRLDPAQVPHGACDLKGLAAQQRVIDRFPRQDPYFLRMRKSLSRADRQVYFKTDPHWTTVGASMFAKAVAEELQPRLGKRQRYTYGTESRVGLFNVVRGIDTPETAESATPATGVKVATDPRSVEDWAGYPTTTLDYAWNSGPARKTWPGHTLLLGDSFMLFALESLRPVFRHGRFMFVGHVKDGDVIKAIKRSDTVVFELLQTFIAFDSIITDKEFRAKLRRALA